MYERVGNGCRDRKDKREEKGTGKKLNCFVLIRTGFCGDFFFIYRSGVMRGHEKTPSFMAGMKCLPHRHVLIMSAANNSMRPIDSIKV
jgi:hypothetical protein